MRNIYMNIYANAWCFCLLALASLSTVSTLQSCITPTKADGYCVPLMDCSWYTGNTRKFGQRSYPRAFVHFVQRSKCFVENGQGEHMCCVAASVQQTPARTTTIRTPATPTDGLAFKSGADYTSKLNRRGVDILNGLECGTTDGYRVSNGENASLFEFPWMALLRYNTNGNQFHCGGSLITTKHVLTAAHCIDTNIDLIGVRLGEWDIDSDPDIQIKGDTVLRARPVQDIEIVEKIVHPEYKKYQMINDVGLLKLKSEVIFDQHIRPICLPITQQSIDHVQKEFFIAGWGTTEMGTTSKILQKAIVKHRPLQVCQDIFKTASVNDNTICAGGTSDIDTCKGDSGGPLFYSAPYRLAPRYVQFGIVSFGGVKCGQKRAFPSIYASVIQFMPWITNQLD